MRHICATPAHITVDSPLEQVATSHRYSIDTSDADDRFEPYAHRRAACISRTGTALCIHALSDRGAFLVAAERANRGAPHRATNASCPDRDHMAYAPHFGRRAARLMIQATTATPSETTTLAPTSSTAPPTSAPTSTPMTSSTTLGPTNALPGYGAMSPGSCA